jgi:Trehalose and maltose hydrolases (possible phosphorylases)
LVSTKYENYNRYIDYNNGETVRSYEFITRSNKRAYLKFRRLASFVYYNVVAYRIEVTYDGEIELLSVLDGDVRTYANPDDPRLSSEQKQLMKVIDLGENLDTSYLLMETSYTNLRQATIVKHIVISENEYTIRKIQIKDNKN